jgi:hypothetical protein
MIRIALIAHTAAVMVVLTAGPAMAWDDKVRPGMTAAEVEAKLGKPAARARYRDRLLVHWERPGGRKKAEPRTYVFDERERLVGPLRPERSPAPPRP